LPSERWSRAIAWTTLAVSLSMVSWTAPRRRALKALPVGLAPGAEVIRAVAPGEIVIWDVVKLDEDSVVLKHL